MTGRVVIVAALGVLAAACGGGSGDDGAAEPPDFVVQGERSVELETTVPAIPSDQAQAGAGEAGGVPTFDETESTIPTGDEEDPDAEFFDAVGDFMACLSTEGYTFMGIPDGGDETAPVNDPSYGEALGGCAASTQIVTKMTAAEDTSGLTAAEIEESNRAFTDFVDCLKGRGWDIPTPTPDENGVLQPAYVEIAQTWVPPDGTSIMTDGSIETDDFAECGFTPDAFN